MRVEGEGGGGSCWRPLGAAGVAQGAVIGGRDRPCRGRGPGPMHGPGPGPCWTGWAEARGDRARGGVEAKREGRGAVVLLLLLLLLLLF